MKNKVFILFLTVFLFFNTTLNVFADNVSTQSLIPGISFETYDKYIEYFKKNNISYLSIKFKQDYEESFNKYLLMALIDGAYPIIKDGNLRVVDNTGSDYYGGTTAYNFDINLNFTGSSWGAYYPDGTFEIVDIFYADDYKVGDDAILPDIKISKEDIKNFNFPSNQAYFYTPSNNSTINFHYKDQYIYKFNARLYVRSYGDIFISDKKIMEMLLSTLQISSPFKLYDYVGTYVERPSITNNFESKFYIDLVLGFPSNGKMGNYTLTASFPGSGTSQNEDIKSASVIVNITNDGSKQEGIYDEEGSIESPSNGSSIGGGSSINGDDFPSAPGKDGSISDWFNYIGSLIMWIITYPFKLLGDVFNVLTHYINVMVNQLTETSRAVTGLFTFIPQDILNVTFGVISFTLLYSVVRGVLKLIRG